MAASEKAEPGCQRARKRKRRHGAAWPASWAGGNGPTPRRGKKEGRDGLLALPGCAGRDRARPNRKRVRGEEEFLFYFFSISKLHSNMNQIKFE